MADANNVATGLLNMTEEDIHQLAKIPPVIISHLVIVWLILGDVSDGTVG